MDDAPMGRAPPISRRERTLRVACVLALCAIAVAWLWLSLLAIVNYALRYPAFDQYHFYPKYFDMPFPAGALQAENGHHPIWPVLIRLGEIRWGKAGQGAQMLIGCIALLLNLGLMVWVIAREKVVDPIARASACVFAVLALLWLGNARMLIHANEILHVEFVILFTLLALLALWRSTERGSSAWMAVAALFCAGATFSFGSGIASFVALFVVALVQRIPLRRCVVPVAILLGVIAIYMIGLPGEEKIRLALSLQPVEQSAQALRWLASPWMRGWLGFAEPPVDASFHAAILAQKGIAAALAASARGLADVIGGDWPMREGVIVGGIGVLLYIACLVHASRFRVAQNASRAMALGLATFALIAAVLVALARASAFAKIPLQVYADRYVPWSCLFWFGLALYATSGRSPRRGKVAAFALAAGLASVILIPSERALAGWSATVHRANQQSAVAAQLGIWDTARFPDNGDARRADVLTTLQRLRDAQVSMFAEPAYRLYVEDSKPFAVAPDVPRSHVSRIVREFDDDLGQRRVAAFEGVVPRIEHMPRDATLVVVDASGRLRGLAKLDFIANGSGSLRWGRPVKRGFDGYVLSPMPGEALRILVLSKADAVIGVVDLDIPATPPTR